MELWFIFVAGGLFMAGIMIYVLFMVFLPEWVGITGKKALEAERSHAGDTGSDVIDPADDVLNRMENLPHSKQQTKQETGET